jgi:hypothetical protein
MFFFHPWYCLPWGLVVNWGLRFSWRSEVLILEYNYWLIGWFELSIIVWMFKVYLFSNGFYEGEVNIMGEGSSTSSISIDESS